MQLLDYWSAAWMWHFPAAVVYIFAANVCPQVCLNTSFLLGERMAHSMSQFNRMVAQQETLLLPEKNEPHIYLCHCFMIDSLYGNHKRCTYLTHLSRNVIVLAFKLSCCDLALRRLKTDYCLIFA